MAPSCPRCHTPVLSAPDGGGFVTCSGCGARLRTRPPGASTDPAPTAAASAPPALQVSAPGATLEAVLAEIRYLRRLQEEALGLLRRYGTPNGEAGALGDDDRAAPAPPLRSQHAKSVLLIDDDEASLGEAATALERAQIPVRTAGDGHRAMAVIAEEKPDVIALELGLGGALAGKDVVNMIKATMEWVDIPIVLYTRLPVESQKEARTTHGADEFVLKSSGPEALVSKIIMLFRRG